MALGKDDEHTMVPAEAYQGQPGSGAPGAQPFRVRVAPGAELIMDFHAHMNMNEVRGRHSSNTDALLHAMASSCGGGRPRAQGGDDGPGHHDLPSPASWVWQIQLAHHALQVIGLLGGYYDEHRRVIDVMRAFPVRELATDDDSINVEMDPENEFTVREEIENKFGMR